MLENALSLTNSTTEFEFCFSVHGSGRSVCPRRVACVCLLKVRR